VALPRDLRSSREVCRSEQRFSVPSPLVTTFYPYLEPRSESCAEFFRAVSSLRGSRAILPVLWRDPGPPASGRFPARGDVSLESVFTIHRNAHERGLIFVARWGAIGRAARRGAAGATMCMRSGEVDRGGGYSRNRPIAGAQPALPERADPMLGLDLQGAAAEVRADHRCCPAASIIF
jgi:hypothetical protein